MRKTIFVFCVLLAALACAPTASAQDNHAQPAEPAHFYHLKLVVQELDADGKITNSRSYSTTVSTGPSGTNSIRAGSRLPVASGAYPIDEKLGIPQNIQFQYIDLGTNFDIQNVHESDRQLSFHVKADISSYGGKAPIAHAAATTYEQPVIRHNQWEAPLLIPLDKSTVIFTSDLLENKGAMQIVATVTPIP